MCKQLISWKRINALCTKVYIINVHSIFLKTVPAIGRYSGTGSQSSTLESARNEFLGSESSDKASGLHWFWLVLAQ